MSRPFEDVIVDVLDGRQAVVSSRSEVRSISSSLVPVAVHKTATGAHGGVLMLVLRTDGLWQCEVALAMRNENGSWRLLGMGGSGWDDPEQLWTNATLEAAPNTEVQLDDGNFLTSVAGFSPQPNVVALIGDRVVGDTQTQEHGMFVIVSVVPKSDVELDVKIRNRA